ncbi:LysE family translocator [Albimonas sp. CAU 1670]|uniref:LysE family translocator n=1 Tax=Albimonas sp. CAU 1670 TaxID=3032599 RepID=UPI0023DAA658|nr:LysE family translocator [Albimonas sp. CAU 1670]MDF2232596.1 LysE family translocator [Albimonas sp. CAU 1670]
MSAWQLIAFVPAALLMALTPGPSNLLAFANAATRGWGAAVVGVFGRLAAYGLLIAGVAFGLGALLAASAGLAAAIKWAGVAYLLWLAWKIWSAPVEGALAEAQARAKRLSGRGVLARREFLTGIANPKALVLFTAFLPQFVQPDAPAGFASQLLALGAVYLLCELAAAATWAGAGAALGAGGMSRARRRAVNRLSGGLLAAAAALLARAGRAA